MIIKLAISLGVTVAVLAAFIAVMIVLLKNVAVGGEIILGVVVIFVFVCIWSATYDLLYYEDEHKRH